MTSATVEARVREQLDEADEPLDQDELIELLLSSGEELERQDVLRALRVLMEQDEVSYNLNWNLQLER